MIEEIAAGIQPGFRNATPTKDEFDIGRAFSHVPHLGAVTNRVAGRRKIMIKDQGNDVFI